MSVGKHIIPDDALSKRHIDKSIDALLDKVKINRDYWIPYLAGYSTDWDGNPHVFIDSRLPEKLEHKGVTYSITRYLLIHECVEKCLMHDLGMHYLLAHNIATGAEKSAVEADGLSWKIYTDLLQPYIRRATLKPEDKESPEDLDKAPYEQEHFAGLDKMK